ncbi:hypothetical protein [Trichocoleus sp. DQ-A1]
MRCGLLFRENSDRSSIPHNLTIRLHPKETRSHEDGSLNQHD